MKVKEESAKIGLKLNIQKIQWQVYFMAINEETMETLRNFIFLVSKITADGDCSHEIKQTNKQTNKMLAPWKKSYDKPRQHVKNQRHHFDNKGPYSQSYGFSSSHVWM